MQKKKFMPKKKKRAYAPQIDDNVNPKHMQKATIEYFSLHQILT